MQRITMGQPSWNDDMRKAAMETLDSLQWVKGKQSIAFGAEFAQYCGAKHGTACQSGSVALWAALRLLGIGPGDEVIVPSLTYIATATCVSLVGATPIFADVDDQYWCITPQTIEPHRTPRTKAIIAVHLFGQLATPELVEYCQHHQLSYIEDAAQAHGASLNTDEVQMAGSFGDLACFSFFPSKNLAVGGEGGMIMTKRDDIVSRMKAIVNHGRDGTLESHEVGSNLRMSEVAAAIGRIQLQILPQWIHRRQWIASQYHEHFASLDGCQPPSVRPHTQHAWHQYCLLVERPDELREHLDQFGIDSRVYYKQPCHRQSVFRNHPQSNHHLEVTDSICHRLVAIPIHHELTDGEVKHIINTIISFYH